MIPSGYRITKRGYVVFFLLAMFACSVLLFGLSKFFGENPFPSTSGSENLRDSLSFSNTGMEETVSPEETPQPILTALSEEESAASSAEEESKNETAVATTASERDPAPSGHRTNGDYSREEKKELSSLLEVFTYRELESGEFPSEKLLHMMKKYPDEPLGLYASERENIEEVLSKLKKLGIEISPSNVYNSGVNAYAIFYINHRESTGGK